LAWKSSATFWKAVFPGSWFALCHQVKVTSLPPATWLGSPLPAADGLAGVELLAELVSVVELLLVLGLGLLLALFLLELHAARPSAATAARLTAASDFE
jgi:hypothetical protein